ncbi:coatomer subunit delta [Phakopsora pachyrhizi]|nr:coatomer subunit delta [Phakopsora pachyrhizi]
MVVLSASIVTKGGKPVISRQFREFPRARLESLLATFPKLVPPSSQHTVIDDPASAIRYVYQPVEDLWLVVLTNRQSNILQDIETLHLLSRIVSDFCRGSVTESEVLGRSFEVLSSFDEVICMGYREKVDLNGIRSVMEMESHEEKIQEIIAKNKEQEAKEELKRRAKQLDSQRREAAKRGQADIYSTGMGSRSGYEPSYQTPQPSAPVTRDDSYSNRAPAAAKPFKKKGMQLGSKSKGGAAQGGLLDALGDDYVPPSEPLLSSAPQSSISPATQTLSGSAAASNAKTDTSPFAPENVEEVHLVIREKLSAELARDGGLASSSSGILISGSLDLKVSSAAASKIWITLNHGSLNGSIPSSDLQFKTHPNVDKKTWADSHVVRLKDPARGFPVGQGLGVLKWRLTSKDETMIPVSINCWPTANEEGGCDVNIEYEAENENLKLHNLIISIPLPEDSFPKVSQCDGSWEIQTSESALLQWKIEGDENGVVPSGGSMEFSCPNSEPDSFFPVSIDFISENLLSQVSVSGVVTSEGENSLEFSTDSMLSTDEYVVV